MSNLCKLLEDQEPNISSIYITFFFVGSAKPTEARGLREYILFVGVGFAEPVIGNRYSFEVTLISNGRFQRRSHPMMAHFYPITALSPLRRKRMNTKVIEGKHEFRTPRKYSLKPPMDESRRLLVNGSYSYSSKKRYYVTIFVEDGALINQYLYKRRAAHRFGAPRRRITFKLLLKGNVLILFIYSVRMVI